MKKIILLLAFIGMIVLQSCTVNETQPTPIDKDTIAEVFEYKGVNFSSNNNFNVTLNFPHTIYSSDMVLMYRLNGLVNGNPVWKPLPQSFYLNDGTLDFRYDFDFTKFDTMVFMDGFDLASISNSYRTNQVFRVVVIPAYLSRMASSKKTINFNDYNAVVKQYKIDDSKL